MDEYRGIAYELRWVGRWEWTIFEKPDDGTGICKGTLECSGPTESWQSMANASIRAQIDEMLAHNELHDQLSDQP